MNQQLLAIFASYFDGVPLGENKIFLQDELWWDTIINQAQQERTASLLYHVICSQSSVDDMVPTAALTRLKTIYHQTVYHNLLLYNQLTKLLRLFANASIPVIGLKGVHVAEFVYPERALRPMRDIDLLVQPQHLKQVDHFLQGDGYSGVGNRSWYRENHFHYQYKSQQAVNRTVEVHWDIQNARSAFHVDMTNWWKRAQIVTIADTQMNVLSAEDLLIHLSIHLIKHYCQDGFRPLIDIAVLIQAELIDWELLLKIGGEEGVMKPLGLALMLTADLLHIAPPDPIMQRFKQLSLPQSAYGWFYQQLLQDESHEKQIKVSTQFARLWRTPDPLKKISVLLESLRLPVDSIQGDVADAPESATNEESAKPAPNFGSVTMGRAKLYSGRIWQLMQRDRELMTEIDVMYWLSSR